MRIWFSGGEVPKHRSTLSAQGVNRLAFNVSPVIESRSGNAGDAESFMPYETVFYSSQADVDPDRFADVVRRYGDDTSLVIDHEVPGFKFVPVWYGSDIEDFYSLAVEHEIVCIDQGDASNDKLKNKIAMFQRRNPHVRIFVISSTAAVLSLPFITDAIVAGWLSAQKYRELQVWDGRTVNRSPRATRSDQIDKHHAQIVSLGANLELIKEGDIDENVLLAVKSWLQYEQVVTTDNILFLPSIVEEMGQTLAIGGTETRHRSQEDLPTVIRARDDEGNIVNTPVQINQSSMRVCDACNLSHVCPKYEPGASCAFRIPIQIRTKDQLNDMFSALMEIQAQRVLMERFAEELLSQGIKPELSKEMERFFRMAESVKRINENRDTVTITASSSGGGGALSSLFGRHVGEKNKELSTPLDPDKVIDEAEIIDSE